MCSSWYNNRVTQQHARCNNENKRAWFMVGTSAGNCANGHGPPNTTKCGKLHMQQNDYHSP